MFSRFPDYWCCVVDISTALRTGTLDTKNAFYLLKVPLQDPERQLSNDISPKASEREDCSWVGVLFREKRTIQKNLLLFKCQFSYGKHLFLSLTYEHPDGQMMSSCRSSVSTQTIKVQTLLDYKLLSNKKIEAPLSSQWTFFLTQAGFQLGGSNQAGDVSCCRYAQYSCLSACRNWCSKCAFDLWRTLCCSYSGWCCRSLDFSLGDSSDSRNFWCRSGGGPIGVMNVEFGPVQDMFLLFIQFYFPMHNF